MLDVIKTPLEEIFGYNTKQSELNEVCKYITHTFIKPKYSSIPKEYYPFLLKLLSFRKYCQRGQYKEDEIKTFFVGNMQGNNCIMFFDNKGKCDSIGIGSALKQWQAEKTNFWKYKKDIVLRIMRNIADISIHKFKEKLTIPVKDEISGELIYDIKDVHIDHYDKDFSELAFDWLYMLKKRQEKYHKRRVDIIDVMYDAADADKKYFSCRDTNIDFYTYHNNNTHLRVTSKQNNLSRERCHPNWDFLKINGCYLEQYAREKELN